MIRIDHWEVGLLVMDKKVEHSPCGADQATEGIRASYSRTSIDIVELMKALGISREKVPESIQQIVSKYQSNYK